MNLETIKEVLENVEMTSQAREVLETVIITLEDCEVDNYEIKNAIQDEVYEDYYYNAEESLQYLQNICCDYFGDLIDLGMKSASEFACYYLNEEIRTALIKQEYADTKK